MESESPGPSQVHTEQLGRLQVDRTGGHASAPGWGQEGRVRCLLEKEQWQLANGLVAHRLLGNVQRVCSHRPAMGSKRPKMVGRLGGGEAGP